MKNLFKGIIKGVVSGLLMIVIVHLSYCTAFTLHNPPTVQNLMLITEGAVFIVVLLVNMVLGLNQ